MDDAPQLRRKDDTRYRSLERRVIRVEKSLDMHERNVENRLDRLEQRVAFAAGAVGVIVVVTSIIGPVAVNIIIKLSGVK